LRGAEATKQSIPRHLKIGLPRFARNDGLNSTAAFPVRL
jgi:hypothetical protein